MDQNYEHRMTELESTVKKHEEEISNLQRQQSAISDLVLTVKELAIREENVEKSVNEIHDDVKALTSQPANRWNGLVEKIIFTIVAAIVGFMLAKIGFGE